MKFGNFFQFLISGNLGEKFFFAFWKPGQQSEGNAESLDEQTWYE